MLHVHDRVRRAERLVNRVIWRLSLLPIVAVVLSCDNNPFDAAQVPRVTLTVTPMPPTRSGVAIAWQPAGARVVRVYRGAAAGDGYTPALMWSIAASGANSLLSGVEYGTTAPAGGTTDVPAKPLLAGETYTVQVTRDDPKGRGDAFTNTNNRYVGTATITLPVFVP